MKSTEKLHLIGSVVLETLETMIQLIEEGGLSPREAADVLSKTTAKFIEERASLNQTPAGDVH